MESQQLHMQREKERNRSVARFCALLEIFGTIVYRLVQECVRQNEESAGPCRKPPQPITKKKRERDEAYN